MKLVLVSNFHTGTLANLITRKEASTPVSVSTAPFGQVFEPLLDPTHECWAGAVDGVFIWTQPEAISNNLGRLLRYEVSDHQELVSDIERFADAVLLLAERVGWVLLASWTLPFYHRGLGMLDLTDNRGHALAVAQMNLRLAERLKGVPNVFLLNAQKWTERAGERSHDPKLWYMAKIPFGAKVFECAADDICAAISGFRGSSRKIVVVDLDDTLWGGIVGDVGRENLRLGGHDPIGEAFVDFQLGLKALSARGILLAIASKNEEEIALEAIRNHPEMVLSIDDFAAWRINWRDKAENLIEMASELNLGLQSFVFIDDNPVERSRVRDALPEVLVPEWPRDKIKTPSTLAELRCFDQPAISDEDVGRKRMYAEEQERSKSKSIQSLSEWVKSLEMRIVAEKLDRANLKRAAQLLNKTNQMNLRTRRLPEGELWKWAGLDTNSLWTFRVRIVLVILV